MDGDRDLKWTRSRKRSLKELEIEEWNGGIGGLKSGHRSIHMQDTSVRGVGGAASGALGTPTLGAVQRETRIRQLRCDEVACDGDDDDDDGIGGDNECEGNGVPTAGGRRAGTGAIATGATESQMYQESIHGDSNTLCSFQGGTTHLSRLYSTRAATAKRAELLRKQAHRRRLAFDATTSSRREREGTEDDDVQANAEDEHAYKPIEGAAADIDFDTTLAALFEREANDSKRIDLENFDDTANGAGAEGIFGCTPTEFENLVINYYELNGARYKYSSQTTSLAAQYYIRYVSSIATRLRTEKDMELPPWFFVLAACACQRLAVKLEEGNIEDMPAIQMKSHASSDSSKEATEDHETLNGEGYTFTPEMIVWTEGLILNELKWEMHVITPAFFVNPFLQKLSHIRESLYADATKHSSLFLPSIECVEFVLEMARKDLALNTKFRPSIVAAGAIVVAVDVVRSVASKPCNYEMSASSGQKAVLLETMRELLVDGISLRPFTRQQKHQQMSDENNLDACIARLKRRIFNAESEVAGRAQDTQAGVSETTHRLPPSPVTTRMPTLRSLPAMRGGGRGGAAAAAAGRGGKGRGGKREEGGAVVPETSYNQVAFSQGFVSEAASGARPAASPMSAVKP